MYKCNICEKEFSHISNRNRHQKKCGIEQTHICSVCNKEFKSGGALGGHMANCHKEKNINSKQQFKCPICNKIMFTNIGSYNMHIKSHDKDFKSNRASKISCTKQKFFANKEKSKKYLEALSKRKKGQVHSEETKQKISKSVKRYINNLSKEDYSKFIANYINAPYRGHKVKHSKRFNSTIPEQKIINFNIDGLIYNGNSQNALAIRLENQNYKKSIIPDFIYKDGKKFIEVFGIYWHPKEDEEKYINAYKENGYEVLIIWEDEIYNNINNCKEKIEMFIKKEV